MHKKFAQLALILTAWSSYLFAPIRYANTLNGEAFARKLQVVVGLVLALVSLPFTVVGTIGLYQLALGKDATFSVSLLAFVSLCVGVLCSLLAYRLIRGKGVKQGGGILSPIAYLLGSFLFVGLGLYCAFDALETLDLDFTMASISSLVIASLFFTAYRHRRATRNI